MKVKYIDPEVEGVHPLRLKMTDDEMADIMEGISSGADWMTLEEIEAAQDYLFDFIVAEKQTVEGVTTLQ
jgi:hypothetical protein